MNISELKDGDCVVTERGTGFVERSVIMFGFHRVKIRLDGGECINAIRFDSIETINGVGVNDRPIR